MKFDEEYKTLQSNSAKKIADYLLSREDIRHNLDKENKSIAEMMKYIMSEARKRAQNGSACIEDEEVFTWAVHYYDEDEIQVEGTNGVMMTDSEKPEVLPVAKTYEKQEKTKKKKELKPQIDEEQLSLF